jgi:hypothetical protein
MSDHDFYYTIKDSYTPTITTNMNTSDYWYQYPWTYTIGNTVYMYQIFCPKPRCKGIFWGAVDSIVPCPKCSSRVKVTKEPPADYEVQVG